jgi:hypothetical protein
MPDAYQTPPLDGGQFSIVVPCLAGGRSGNLT